VSLNLSLPSYATSENSNISPKFIEDFFKILNREDVGFFRLEESTEHIKQCKVVYQKFLFKKTFVHVGIGGSSLGPEMLVGALACESIDRQFTFINNIDPDEIHRQLKSIGNLEDTLFYIVSKSGGTVETNAILAIILNFLKSRGVEDSELRDYFVFCTDPKTSQLRELAKRHQIDCIPIPSNVGGRFSVLSPAGLLPALFAGIDIDSLVEGAKSMADAISSKTSEYALLIDLFSGLKNALEKNVNQTVLMPYSSRLRNFSSWFVQLWAESLGKKENLEGKTLNLGLTPISAFGATDQHSQMQLFKEGPIDKFIIFIGIEKFTHDYPLSCGQETPVLEQLSPFSLSQLMTAELEGTIKAIESDNRPFAKLVFNKCDEIHLGQSIIFFESLTVLMGHHLGIDTFNQPGVEAGKKYALEWLEGI
jgi:glucose-6-phosphate isomerase